MEQETVEKSEDPQGKKIAIQMITFSIIVIVIILTLVSFIRIYSNKKQEILKDMRAESILFETVLTDHLNYSKYFIDIIGRKIKTSPNNYKRTQNILKEHFTSQDFNQLFGWRKHSWIDENFYEVVTSTKGILEKPIYKSFVKDHLDDLNESDMDWIKNIVFYTSKNDNKGNSLKIINNIMDVGNKEYVGSVILSYDIDTMINSLNIRKKNNSTHFVIIDQNLEVIGQSKSAIRNVINEDRELDAELYKTVKKLGSTQELEDLPYLDMVNGVNYFISSLKDLPFTVIVNIDNEVIKKDIINSITKNFIEVCIFALACLLTVISVYKRETYLRTKAEKATLVANNAAKAKSNFLAFTAHEIRSPLGFILTGSELMTKELIGKLPKEYKKYAQGIHENSKVILDFITDILDENQIIEGKFKIINVLTNVGGVIDEAIKVNITRFNKRKVKIVSDIEENLPLLVCDKRRILQVFSNLISNGIKYSKDGTTITIQATVVNEEMVIQVIDQGIGMSMQDVPIALSTYGILQGKNYIGTGSYGLGLPIVKMLLEAHDARLFIDSKEGEGTTIKIIFPKYKLIYNTNLNNDGI